MNTLINNYVTLLNRAYSEFERLERAYMAGGSPEVQANRAKWLAHYQRVIKMYNNYINALQS